MKDPPTPTRWSLRDLLAAPDGEEMDSYLARMEEALARLEAARPRLAPEIPAGEFLTLLGDYEALTGISRRLGAYAFLWFAEDTQNQAALNLQGQLDRRLADAQNRALFFELWFKELPDEAAARLIGASGDRSYFLESLRRFRPHTLSEAEEKVITLKDVNGIDALMTLYDVITNKLTFSLEVEGRRQTLTHDELTAFTRHPSPALREAAYRELYRAYGENSTALAEIYNHRVRDWQIEMVELRHFASPIAARNMMNDIPDAVIDTLLDVCRRNASLFQRYFRLKARWLKLGKLRRYDLYAPLARSEKSYSFAQAVELVLGSLTDFSPLMAERARRVLDQDHLDAELRPGKRSGAFCYAALPQLTPWVLANFAGRARDVTTLAHELGHAIHAMLAAEHSVLTFDAAVPLAETASVFGEMLLTERLLAQESDPAVRRDLLASAIDDAYVTVQRQAYFCVFERDAHRLIDEGRSADELAAHYQANLAEQFGDAVAVSDEFRWEWLLIPHIYHTPFYTYAYSFGQLLVLALYQRYRAEGEPFKPRYLQILARGGSAAPAAILAEADIDIASAAFWQGGFDVIKGLIDELEALGMPAG